MLEKLMVMDYKKIVKSRKLRFLILNCCSWVPDSIMLRVQYYIKMGRRLSLKHPRRFSEKLQWYKLYYRNPLMFTCVDKYDVRGYISSKDILICLMNVMVFMILQEIFLSKNFQIDL